MRKETKEEADRRRLQAINWLLSILEPGQSVFCLKHRPKGSNSASCHWLIFAVDSASVRPCGEEPQIVDITSKVARATGTRLLPSGRIQTTSYASEIISALSLAIGYPHDSLKERTL